jgi:hypothetical protein
LGFIGLPADLIIAALIVPAWCCWVSEAAKTLVDVAMTGKAAAIAEAPSNVRRVIGAPEDELDILVSLLESKKSRFVGWCC